MIRRLLWAALAALLFASPASATTLLAVPITTAVTAQVSAAQQLFDGPPRAMAIQCNFTYGSGGTTVQAWIQTSFDEQTTWVDVATCYYTTSSLRQLFNLSSLTPQTTIYTATDGTLSPGSSSAKDGYFGNWWRVKYTTTGTYAGGTTLNVDLQTASRLRAYP